LHKRFDSWEIAIAAYNWGQTAIKRAVKRNLEKGKPTSFHHLKLPDETRHHVFKLLALKNIIANPAWYDIQLKAIPNRPYFAQVKVDNHIDTAIVAKLAGITLDEFKALNPAYNRPIVKVLSEPRTILLPVDKAEVFQERINSFDEPLMTWHIYTVKRGDALNTLAKNNGVSRNQLRKMNGLTQNEKLKRGQRILLPQTPIPFGSDISIVRKKPNPMRYKQRTTVYTVKKGDTLYGIARRYGLTIKQIKSWNDNNENLSIGQQLILLRT
ncbi:MAG: LysM peptidoglycan-binding domain-containing protein, partial [Nitrosomonas sp.]|nr:LysM peptidoglycan-binding domain-containing protein [Nitrosomonas sp.]